eukprot:3757068-Ditylum_brightwellii.AAC.1
MKSSDQTNGGHNGANTAHSATQPNQNLDRTPVIPAKESPPKKTGKITTFTEHKLKTTFLVGKHKDVKPREKFATLLSLLTW